MQVLELVGGSSEPAPTSPCCDRASSTRPCVARVESLAAGVRFVERTGLGRPDVFHRPFQITSLHELADRLVIGERFVLTHQDMIWDRTRAYHVGDARARLPGRDERRALRARTRSASSRFHAAIDAASDGALALERATVVPLGVDHLAGGRRRGGSRVRSTAGRSS